MNRTLLKALTLSTTGLMLAACDPQKLSEADLAAATASATTSGDRTGTLDQRTDDFTGGNLTDAWFEVTDRDGAGTLDNPTTFGFGHAYSFYWDLQASEASNVRIGFFDVNDETADANLASVSCSDDSCGQTPVICYPIAFNGDVSTAQINCSLDGEGLSPTGFFDVTSGINIESDSLPAIGGLKMELCDSEGSSCDIYNLGYVRFSLETD